MSFFTALIFYVASHKWWADSSLLGNMKTKFIYEALGKNCHQQFVNLFVGCAAIIPCLDVSTKDLAVLPTVAGPESESTLSSCEIVIGRAVEWLFHLTCIWYNHVLFGDCLYIDCLWMYSSYIVYSRSGDQQTWGSTRTRNVPVEISPLKPPIDMCGKGDTWLHTTENFSTRFIEPRVSSTQGWLWQLMNCCKGKRYRDDGDIQSYQVLPSIFRCFCALCVWKHLKACYFESTKSCTTWDLWVPVRSGINYSWTGAELSSIDSVMCLIPSSQVVTVTSLQSVGRLKEVFKGTDLLRHLERLVEDHLEVQCYP